MGEKAAPTKQHCWHIEEGVEMLSRERLDVCQNKSFQLSVSQLWLFSQWYYSHSHLTYLPVCRHCLFHFLFSSFFFFLSRQLFSAFAICNNKKRTPLNRNSCCRIIFCALVFFLILTDFNSGRFHGEHNTLDPRCNCVNLSGRVPSFTLIWWGTTL